MATYEIADVPVVQRHLHVFGEEGRGRGAGRRKVALEQLMAGNEVPPEVLEAGLTPAELEVIKEAGAEAKKKAQATAQPSNTMPLLIIAALVWWFARGRR